MQQVALVYESPWAEGSQTRRFWMLLDEVQLPGQAGL